MAKITNVKGRQIFDSRGNPTVEAEVFLENGISASSISPSGASTGAFEAHELRDKDLKKFLGKSVNKAVENINKKICTQLKNLSANNQEQIDIILDMNSKYSILSKKDIIKKIESEYNIKISLNLFNKHLYQILPFQDFRF